MLAEGSLILLAGFALLLVLGAPLAVGLGFIGAVVILREGLGIMSVPTNAYTGIAKYPLLALPVFILAGMIFERAGVAERLVRFVSVLVGKRAGGPAIVAVLVCMFLGGISGSGPADAAAVAMVMIPGMAAQGYPREFSASLIAAAGSTAILIPPSLAFIVYNILVPQASIPALFAAGLIPGILAGMSLLIPVLYFSIREGWGRDAMPAEGGFWRTFREAVWGLIAPIIILADCASGCSRRPRPRWSPRSTASSSGSSSTARSISPRSTGCWSSRRRSRPW